MVCRKIPLFFIVHFGLVTIQLYITVSLRCNIRRVLFIRSVIASSFLCAQQLVDRCLIKSIKIGDSTHSRRRTLNPRSIPPATHLSFAFRAPGARKDRSQRTTWAANTFCLFSPKRQLFTELEWRSDKQLRHSNCDFLSPSTQSSFRCWRIRQKAFGTCNCYRRRCNCLTNSAPSIGS